MSAGELGTAIDRLVHDVAKHVARTARNLGGGPIPAALVPLLAKDLYRLDGTRAASAVFAEHAAALSSALPASSDAPAALRTLADVSCAFEAIDALRAQVLAGEEGALRRAAELALEVEASLRGLARSLLAPRSPA